jgi:GNAT superfamily N-acetyltransferase
VADSPDLHLAQLNIAKLAAPLDSPQLADFVGNLDRINELGESSPGFVWRLKGDGNDATSLRPFPDDDVIVNMTVWESKNALHEFTYKTDHTQFLRRRREWFVSTDTAMVALWSVPAGHEPTLGEARVRLDHLRAYGASPYAYTFRDEVESLALVRTSLTDPLAQELIGELNTELFARQPGDNHFRLDTTDVAPGRGGFFVAWLDGKPVGCGAIRLLAEGTTGAPGSAAEVKRMWVRPGFQARRIGTAILSHLEGVARDVGASSLALETAESFVEAMALYHRAGFTRIACWGDYATTPLSVCLAKMIEP